MKSNVGKLVLLFLLWWFLDRLASLLSLFLLCRIGVALYKVYKDNTSEGPDSLTVSKERDVVVITGCDSGIGKAIADKLAQKFHVVATVIDTESPAAVALSDKGVKLLQLDLSDGASIENAEAEIDKILANGKRLHGVVNNAGICIMGEMDWLNTEQADTMMKVNLTGPILFTKLLLPRIISDKARVVNVTGLDGLNGTSGLVTYCSSKFGMEGFTDSLRLELAKYGVRVITVRPGDYTSLTCGAHKQRTYSEEMWKEMGSAKQRQYAAEFDAFGKAVLNMSGKLCAANFDGIRSTFEQIMTLQDPDNEYNEGNNLNIVANKILSVLPKSLSAQLREKLLTRIMKIHLYRH